jgi:uncharacterized membrane protein
MTAFALLQTAQEGIREIAQAQQSSTVEHTIVVAVQWLRLAVETTGAIIVALGLILSVYQFLRSLAARNHPDGFNSIRLTLARYLALALEFQLGADILSTAIAPSWEQIGKLGAIAVIRTVLNYFLMREMREERTQPDKNPIAAPTSPTP